MDFILSNTWEEYQRIQLFKKVGNKIENISDTITKKVFKGQIKKKEPKKSIKPPTPLPKKAP